MAYLAIDFETANQQRASACAVGVVRVEDGQVTETWNSLIDSECEFAPMNVSIHGIRADDVKGSPTFPDVLARMVELAEGCELIVAHNAAFDIQVLTGSAARYGIELAPQPFACTRVFARRWWPGWPSYGLSHTIRTLDLASSLGDWQHHDPLWDAKACAAIAERGFADKGVTSWEQAAEAEKVRIGIARPTAYDGCVSMHSSTSNSTTKPIRPSRPDDDELDPNHPLYGLNVCFTGALSLYSRRDAAQVVTDVGGIFSANVTKTTDLLVVGTQDLDRIGEDGTSSKMRKAVEMAARGHHIEVIDEPDFFQMLTPP